ncbi:hypothetical protein CEXT_114651 [Caerostris extrusa]|uniref:Uncharacterized protein n=1 Tax=Caerostris extrusa TaxID=172846 RepID=A0AAV4X7L8_CAEEX|nr:hypothetical protein CEXT_114651 [Caerostris extrusa]
MQWCRDWLSTFECTLVCYVQQGQSDHKRRAVFFGLQLEHSFLVDFAYRHICLYILESFYLLSCCFVFTLLPRRLVSGILQFTHQKACRSSSMATKGLNDFENSLKVASDVSNSKEFISGPSSQCRNMGCGAAHDSL